MSRVVLITVLALAACAEGNVSQDVYSDLNEIENPTPDAGSASASAETTNPEDEADEERDEDEVVEPQAVATGDVKGEPPVVVADAGAPEPVEPAADAGENAGEEPTESEHAGLVPVFLGMGYGTRRVVSCDYGVTWASDEFDTPNGGDDGDLVRGLDYGANKFVAAVGGGGRQALFTSEDGVTWTRFDRGGNGFSDVAFGNDRFVAGGGHFASVSEDGYTWGEDHPMGTGGILRRLTFGDFDGGRFVAVGDGGRRMSSPDGESWGAEVSGGPGLNGVAYGAGVFVATSGGSGTQVSEDGGDTWQSGNIAGADQVRGILYDGKRFIVTTVSSTFTSSDGKSWEQHEANGGPTAFDVSDDGRHYAGSNAGDLYHSTDGIHFEVVKQGGQGLEKVKFGWVKPSSVCPL